MDTIQLKSWKVFKAFLLVPYHPKMIALAEWVATRLSSIVFTSAYREGEGVHGTKPCRGIDIRSYIYEDPKKVVDDINEHWEYDSDRSYLKCAVLHDVGKGVHIHLQVHPNTVYHAEGVSNA